MTVKHKKEEDLNYSHLKILSFCSRYEVPCNTISGGTRMIPALKLREVEKLSEAFELLNVLCIGHSQCALAAIVFQEFFPHKRGVCKMA